MIKEITVFSDGDSKKISTWSNVPYFFTETLISKGIKVNRVDISPNPLYQKYYEMIFDRTIRKIYKNTKYNYFRSYIHFIDVRYRVKKAIKQYPNSDAFIFLTFSFSSAGLTKKPTVLLGDWTYDHYIKYFIRRKPDFLQKQCIKREENQINKSSIVLSLFPGVTKYMRERYKNKNIYYLGNVINSLYHFSEGKDLLEIKRKSNKILFIGSIKYLEGANTLIKTFILLKQTYPELTLHFIGFESSHFVNLPNDVFCYGYLDKAKDTDRDLYYKLLKEAKVFVNTTPKWSAFSASIEAMYFFLPVIVPPYNEFVETFGINMKVGAYCESNSPVLLKEKVEYVMFNKSYDQLCRNAHNSVMDFTWDSYIDKVILKINDLLLR